MNKTSVNLYLTKLKWLNLTTLTLTQRKENRLIYYKNIIINTKTPDDFEHRGFYLILINFHNLDFVDCVD